MGWCRRNPWREASRAAYEKRMRSERQTLRALHNTVSLALVLTLVPVLVLALILALAPVLAPG